MSTNIVDNFSFVEKRRQESGKRLKKARIDARYSQQQVADLLEVDRSTIGKWERGTPTPSVDDYLKMAELYSVNAIYLTAIDVVPTQKDYEKIESGLSQLEREANVLGSMQLSKDQSLLLLRSSLKLIETYIQRFESED